MKRLMLLVLVLSVLTCSGCASLTRFLLPGELRENAETMYVGANQMVSDIDDGAEADGTPVTLQEARDELDRQRQYLAELLAVLGSKALEPIGENDNDQ